MNEERWERGGSRGGGGEEELLARLVSLAGSRRPIPEQRRVRVEEAVRGQWRRVVRARRRRRWALASAAVLAVGLGAAAWWQATSSPPTSAGVVAKVDRVVGMVRLESPRGGDGPLARGQHLGAGTVLTTDEDGRAALGLPGGASLRLDVGTRVRLTEGGRFGLEAGALYLDSPPGARGIRVTTPWGEVRDIGTQLEVRVDGQGVRVRVREGRALLSAPHARAEAPAGTELYLGAASGLARRKVALHGAEWDWVSSIAPPFELEGATLGELLAWVSRERGREIRFAEEELLATAPSIVLHGSVEELTPQEALLAVLPTCGLEHRLEPDGSYLLWRSR